MSDVLPTVLAGDWPGPTGRRFSVPRPPAFLRPHAAVRHPAAPDGTADGRIAVRGFGPAPQDAAAAREFTGETLRGWGLGPLVDDVAVIVSELVGNALRYGMTAGPRPPLPAERSERPAEGPVRLGLLWRGPTLLCAVSDPSPATPVLGRPDQLSETGRGLHIIDALSQNWGWSPPGSGGKTVWATVSVGRACHRPGNRPPE
ncbi:ATP-binding protein [Streptomyces sp. TRM 70361]|nr:ATP-binding protein [Streptomyces sp. TRM 70361]MEE1941285.1 ATP-binding protein [Streptomyces sp. TRM 70361]